MSVQDKAPELRTSPFDYRGPPETSVPLNVSKQDTAIQDSLRGKRYRAALDEIVLEAILFPENSK